MMSKSVGEWHHIMLAVNEQYTNFVLKCWVWLVLIILIFLLSFCQQFHEGVSPFFVALTLLTPPLQPHALLSSLLTPRCRAMFHCSQQCSLIPHTKLLAPANNDPRSDPPHSNHDLLLFASTHDPIHSWDSFSVCMRKTLVLLEAEWNWFL